MRNYRLTHQGEPTAPSLKIVVDMPWDASACMGTGAYSESMVRALAKAAPECALTLIVPPGTPSHIELPNVRYASLPVTDGLSEGTRQIALPSYLAATQADCLFAPASLVPAAKVCPTVATVHDLAFETHGEYYSPEVAAYLGRWFPSTLLGADRIVAISVPVKQDLLFRKRISPEKVTVIEQPIRETFLRPLSEEAAQAELGRMGIRAPFFFHVSNLAAHKNMEFGVRAFAEYLQRHPESRQDLLFAGGGFAPSMPPDLGALAQTLGIGSRVKYVGKVTDQALKALYQRCDAFLFPSLIEGWGLPVVEARTLGASVLASPHVPSALPLERVPLEIEPWVGALANPPRGASSVREPREEAAGIRLLETIEQAIETFRESGGRPIARAGVPAPPPQGPRVAIRGDWHSPSGFGEAARGVFRALRSAGVEPISVSVPKDGIQDRRLWRESVSLALDSADLWIHHLPPDHIDLGLPGRHASFFFWETDRLPGDRSGSEWSKVLSMLDEIWAPSTFVEEVLGRSGISASVHRIPPPVDTALYHPGARRPPSTLPLPTGFDPSWSVFLYVGTWDPRKRPDLLVRAFTRAFTEKDQAILVIKSYVTGDAERDRQILGDWISRSCDGKAHVRAIPEILSPDHMADLFRFATAFCTATRGEGYCLPAVQAMSTGRPVVAPGWSAFQDYPILSVDFDLRPVPREVTLPGYSPEQNWAEVNLDDLSRKLRLVHERRDEARLLGREGRNWVVQNCAREVVGKRLKDRIHALSRNLVQPMPLEVVR